jgi:2-dehydropantoate 2-reductase
MKPNILIAGTGAIGGYFGSQLAINKNLNVYFLVRGKALNHYKKYPLRIHSTVHKDISVMINVSDNMADFKKKFDYVFVCTKSKDTSSLIPEIKKVTKKKTQIVTLQNGLYNFRILKEHLGKTQCLQAICKIGADVDNKFVVRHTSLGFLVLGEEKGKPTKRVLALSDLLTSSGIKVKVSYDFQKEIWIKFAWNTIFNTLTGITGQTVDKLFSNRKKRLFIDEFYIEVKNIAQSQGVLFDDDAYKKIIKDTFHLGKFKTSAYQDIRKNKELETPYFTSELLKITTANKIKADKISALHNQSTP